MNILYIAYSCKPNKGSEEKIGWNIPLESAKHNKVFVITKTESREAVEEYLRQNPTENIKFYYVDIANFYKKIFKGVMYTGRLNRYHKKAYPLAEKICQDEKIDIIHQITPIEFRSVGKFKKIKGVKFVCGPLGGAEYFPTCFKRYAKGNMWVENIRGLLNFYSKLKYKIFGTLKKCDYLLFANKETEKYLSGAINTEKSALFSEVGIAESEIAPKKQNINSNEKLVLLVASRLAYRKGHAFLLEALKELPQGFDYECRFLGEGPLGKVLKKKVKEYGLEQKVVFKGRLPYEEMVLQYREADAFIMPSIREATGTVLVEALCHSLPIITINGFGGRVLLNDDCTYFYNGENLEEYKQSLKECILSVVTDKNERLLKGKSAHALAYTHTWSKKIEFYNSIYKQVLEG